MLNTLKILRYEPETLRAKLRQIIYVLSLTCAGKGSREWP